MNAFLLGFCLILFSIYGRTSSCKPTQPEVSRVVRSKRSLPQGQYSEETFRMFVKERGSSPNEKVSFDMSKKTVVRHHVLAYRDSAKADFMVDFDANVTVTRLPENGCYIAPRSPDQLSMNLLRKSMRMRSSGRYARIGESVKVLNELVPTRLADRSKLTKKIKEFCRGLPIYHMTKKV